jgi:hypothetical protein
MFFTFPEDAHWNAERRAVEFGVEIGKYRGVVRVPRRVFQRLLADSPTPRAVRRSLLPTANSVRARSRAEAPAAAVDRGRRCRNQWAGFALSAGWGPCQHARGRLKSTRSGRSSHSRPSGADFMDRDNLDRRSNALLGSGRMVRSQATGRRTAFPVGSRTGAPV